MNWMIMGAPVVAIIVGGWGHIKNMLSKLRSLIIVTVVVHDQLADAVSLYCWKELNRMRFGDRRYGGRKMYLRSKDEYRQVSYEIIGEDGIVFWKGKRPSLWNWIIIGASSSGNESKEQNDTLEFSFIRGAWDIDKLILEATESYNKHIVDGFQDKRFFISKKYGSIGSSDNGVEVLSIADTRLYLWDKRLVGVDVNDIGQKLHESGKPFESLSFPDEINNSIRDIKRWKESKEWYKDKGIPWKRGWLLYGPPGTGKTSLVKAIGEYLDIPVISFNLSSFSDREFQFQWDNLRAYAPCIALIEDIDTVFKGRTNIIKGGELSKPLSFDTLLNMIDGITISDGVFTIVTTNNIEDLDEALGVPDKDGKSSRPGRIDKIIKLDVLDKKCRKDIANRIISAKETIDKVVADGNGETGAQFQDRCCKIALGQYWEDKNEAV